MLNLENKVIAITGVAALVKPPPNLLKLAQRLFWEHGVQKARKDC